MMLPFIPVVFSVPQSGEELLTLDGHKMLGAMPGSNRETTICNDKGEITGDMSWKNRRTTGDFGETTMAGKCFCQVWPDLSFQESMFFSTPSGDDPRSFFCYFCLGKMGYITNRYGCEFMLHQLHGYGSWWIFQREKTGEVRSSLFC